MFPSRRPLTPAEIEERRETIRDVLANAALEGLEPTPAFLALIERFVVGEITIEQAIKSVNAGELRR